MVESEEMAGNAPAKVHQGSASLAAGAAFPARHFEYTAFMCFPFFLIIFVRTFFYGFTLHVCAFFMNFITVFVYILCHFTWYVFALWLCFIYVLHGNSVFRPRVYSVTTK